LNRCVIKRKTWVDHDWWILPHMRCVVYLSIFEQIVFNNQFLSTKIIIISVGIVDIFCSPFSSSKIFLLYGWAIQKCILWSWERFTPNTQFGRHMYTETKEIINTVFSFFHVFICNFTVCGTHLHYVHFIKRVYRLPL